MSADKKTGLTLVGFEEVNFQLRNIVYFENLLFDKKKLLFDIDFEVKLKDQNLVEILLHTEYAYLKNEERKEISRVFHGDYIGVFKTGLKDEMLIEEPDKILVKSEVLKKILGIMVSTTRGYLLARSKGSIIQNFPLPIIYPEALIAPKGFFVKDGFIQIT